MNTLICTGCPANATYDPKETGGNINALRDTTGFTPIIHDDTSIGWWCPNCLDKALPHIEALMVLLGEEGHPHKPGITFWNCLPRMVIRLRLLQAEHQKEVGHVHQG